MRRKKHKIKYPKLTLLLIVIIIAIAIFYEGRNYPAIHDFIVSLGYFGTFISGIFYAYGFTAPPATAILLVLSKEQSLIVAVLIGGVGAVLSDFLIFSFIRHSFIDELDKLKKEKPIKFLVKIGKFIFGRYYKFILPIFAGFLIASPLPTEIGVTILAGQKHISVKKFMIMAYALHSLGIFIILTVGHLI